MATGGGFVVNCTTYGTYLCYDGEWVWKSNQDEAYRFTRLGVFLRVVRSNPALISRMMDVSYRLVQLVQPTRLEERVLVE